VANKPGDGMTRVLAVSMLMLAGTTCPASAAESKTFSYTCKNGNFAVTA